MEPTVAQILLLVTVIIKTSLVPDYSGNLIATTPSVTIQLNLSEVAETFVNSF